MITWLLTEGTSLHASTFGYLYSAVWSNENTRPLYPDGFLPSPVVFPAPLFGPSFSSRAFSITAGVHYGVMEGELTCRVLMICWLFWSWEFCWYSSCRRFTTSFFSASSRIYRQHVNNLMAIRLSILALRQMHQRCVFCRHSCENVCGLLEQTHIATSNCVKAWRQV